MIIGNTVKDAVISKIATAYPSISIREETIQQGSERPFFYVSQIDMTQWKESTNKYNRLYQIKVVYQVDINDTETKFKLDAMGTELFDILDTIYLKVGELSTTYPVKGIQMSYKTVEDEMQFFVSYPIRVYKKLEDTALQQQLSINTTTKTEE